MIRAISALSTYRRLISTKTRRRIFRGLIASKKIGRKALEHRKTRTLLGSQIAAAFIFSSIYAPSAGAQFSPSQTQAEPVISVKAPVLDTQVGFDFPLKEVRINQGYSFGHPGIDFGGITGEPIYPAMSGKVILVQELRYDYGKYVVVDHGGGTQTLYAHMSKINVKLGDNVTHQTILGLVGATGHATGPHLHFEVWVNGVHTNPFAILPKLG